MSRLAEAVVVEVDRGGGLIHEQKEKKTFLPSGTSCHHNERVTDTEGNIVKQNCKVTKEFAVGYSRSCLFG